MSERTNPDRRQSTRYAPKTDFFVAFWPYLDRVGKLKDVSSSGAAFEYPVLANYENVVDVEVDIFTSEPNRFLLHHMPCKVVYDIKIDQPGLSGVETRRCGLKFDQSSHQHSEKLKLLLDNYVSQPLPFK
jgi:hypothetical protein